MTQQYNFKIESELKEQLEQEQEKSTAENKSEFLFQMFQAYQLQKQTSIDTTMAINQQRY